MARPKINFQDLLLKKGEYIALGAAGVGLLVLLIWGATTLTGATSPDDHVKKSKGAAQAIRGQIQAQEVPEDEKARIAQELELNKWPLDRPLQTYPMVPPEEFPLASNLFDPVGRPDTKWEVPQVLGIREFQVDLIRAPMKGFDIIYDNAGKAQIAVLETKSIAKLDTKKLDEARDKIKKNTDRGRTQFAQNVQNNPNPMGPMGPGGPGGETAYGFGGGPYDQTGMRTETTIKYVPLDVLDDQLKESKLPAATVIPLRMVVVQASFPLKEQEEAVRRALRLPVGVDVSAGVRFDGFDVKRKVILPGGQPLRNKDTDKDGWADYKYDDRYIELINSRKMADYFDVLPVKQPNEPGYDDYLNSLYLPYFLERSYAEAMALPLPELVPGHADYPTMRLPSIVKNIEALRKQNTPKLQSSDLVGRLAKQGQKRDIFVPKTALDTGASGLGYTGAGPEGSTAGPRGGGPMGGAGPRGGGFNPIGSGGGPRPGPGGVQPKNAPGMNPDPMGMNPENTEPPVTIDHLLIRFVDCDVRPGYTYEYQISVRMENPVWGKEFEDRLADRTAATDPARKILRGPWVPLGGSLTVPLESFVFAGDPGEYNKKVEAAYPLIGSADQKIDANTRKAHEAIQQRLLAKDRQAVIQVLTWMEQVRTEAGGVREPVGAWVQAEMPVGRGEYVGRKSFVKLPLWSSTQNNYTFREIPGKTIPTTPLNPAPIQPQGWLVDFTADKSVLVDFTGGNRVETTIRRDQIVRDDGVATELLIVRNDGKLVVRNTTTDADDTLRKQLSGGWAKWLAEVEKAKALGTGIDPKGGGFERPDPNKKP